MKTFDRCAALGALTAAALFSGAAHAECEVGDPGLDQHIVAKRQLAAGGDTELVRNLRNLRRGALVLKKYDRDADCRAVVSAIRQLLQDPDAVTTGRSEAEAGRKSGSPSLKAKRESAKSLVNMGGRVRAGNLIGSDLVGLEDELLGEIEDLILAPDGRPAYALISHGGFLGMGEKVIAVPFGLLRASEERDVFFLPMTEEHIEAAPSFERGRFDWLGDKKWRDELETYFQESISKKRS